MAVIANLDVVLAARTEKLDAGFAKGQRSAKSFGKSLSSAGNSLSGMTPSLPIIGQLGPMLSKLGPVGLAAGAAIGVVTVAATAAAAAVSIITAAVKAQLPEIDKLGKSASSIGIAAGDLQSIRLAMGEGGGLDSGAVDKALQKMVKGIGEARQGFGAAGKAAETLGLDVNELANMGANEQFEAIAEEVSKIENISQRNVVLTQIFGKEGAKMAMAMADGAAAARATGEWLEQAGIKLSDMDVKGVEAANDAMGRISVLTDGIAAKLGAHFAPLMTIIAQDAVGIGEAVGRWVDSLDDAVLFAASLYGLAKDIGNVFIGIEQIKMGQFSEGMASIQSGLSLEGQAETVRRVERAMADAALAAAEAGENTGQISAEAEAAAAAAERINAAFADPSDALAEQMHEIKRLAEDGLIDDRVAGQAAAKAANEFAKAMDGLAIGNPDLAISEIQEALSAGLIDDSTANELLDKIEKLKKVDMFGADAIRKADEIAERFKLPEQRFNEEIEELKQLFDNGLINFDQLTAATREASEKLDEATKTGEAAAEESASKQSPTFAAVQASSAAGYQAALRNQRSGADGQVSELKRHSVLLANAETILGRIATGVEQLPPQRVVG